MLSTRRIGFNGVAYCCCGRSKGMRLLLKPELCLLLLVLLLLLLQLLKPVLLRLVLRWKT